MKEQAVRLQVALNNHIQRVTETARGNEQGELVTWLVLAGGLAIVALAVVAGFEIIVDDQVDRIKLSSDAAPTPAPGG